MNLLSWYSLKGYCCWWEHLLWLNLKQGQYDWLGFTWPVKLNDVNAVKWHLPEDNKSLKQKGFFLMFITRMSSVNSEFIIRSTMKAESDHFKIVYTSWSSWQTNQHVCESVNVCLQTYVCHHESSRLWIVSGIIYYMSYLLHIWYVSEKILKNMKKNVFQCKNNAPVCILVPDIVWLLLWWKEPMRHVSTRYFKSAVMSDGTCLKPSHTCFF